MKFTVQQLPTHLRRIEKSSIHFKLLLELRSLQEHYNTWTPLLLKLKPLAVIVKQYEQGKGLRPIVKTYVFLP
jgi:hypothetical protein